MENTTGTTPTEMEQELVVAPLRRLSPCRNPGRNPFCSSAWPVWAWFLSGAGRLPTPFERGRDRSRTARSARMSVREPSRGMRMYHHESDNAQTLFAGEGQLLELISEGAPLQHVLDKLCTALDVQLGNVVSLVLFPEDEEHTLHTIAQRAAKFGLSAFSCTAILSPSEKF